MLCSDRLTKRIALGTVQFGLRYGIANRTGKPAKEEVFRILGSAAADGIDTLDTAYSYGSSEAVIGRFISRSGKKLNIISKAPDLKNGDPDKYFYRSLKRLKQEALYGYLVHSFDNIVKYKKLWDRLSALKKKGLVHNIGVSVYKTEELDYLLDNGVKFDIIQLPYNIFDQRFEGYFSRLKARKVKIYTRSVFLQGFFFLDMRTIGKRFRPAAEKMAELKRVSAKYKIPVRSLCLCFVLLNRFVDKVVIGVDSLRQLKQNISSAKDLRKVRPVYDILRSLKFYDEDIILPYNWK